MAASIDTRPALPVFHAVTFMWTMRKIDEGYQTWLPLVKDEAAARGAAVATREDGFRALDRMGIARPTESTVDGYATMGCHTPP